MTPLKAHEAAKAYQKIQQEESKKLRELIKTIKIPNTGVMHKVAEQHRHHIVDLLKNSYGKSMEGIVANITKSIKPLYNVVELHRLYNEDFRKQTEYFQKRLFEDEPKLRESIKALIDIGWYPDIQDFGYSTLRDLKDDIDNTDMAEIDAAFVKYYQSIADKIQEKLITQFPSRAHIISEAFKAHGEENHIVSIPLILTQIDGIAFDTFKSSFFEKSRGKAIPKISEHITDGIGYFSVSLLVPFQSEQPIIFGRKERDEDFNHLNRHQILHGESIDYNTEVNSCKALSLIYYISQAVEIVKGSK